MQFFSLLHCLTQLYFIQFYILLFDKSRDIRFMAQIQSQKFREQSTVFCSQHIFVGVEKFRKTD